LPRVRVERLVWDLLGRPVPPLGQTRWGPARSRRLLFRRDELVR
jgi:hypothetical protein